MKLQRFEKVNNLRFRVKDIVSYYQPVNSYDIVLITNFGIKLIVKNYKEKKNFEIT